MKHVFLFWYNNGYENEPQLYVYTYIAWVVAPLKRFKLSWLFEILQ